MFSFNFNDMLSDRKFVIQAVILFLLLAGIVVYGKFAGLILILGLVVFGSLSLLWKEPRIRIAGMAMLVILAFANIGINGLKFGIDFSGGTRIPIILEHAVDSTQMSELIDTVKKRVSVLGLTEAKVRAVGDAQINVEIPFTDEASIGFIEQTIARQGVYQGIVDGKIAISGDRISPGSIRPANQQSQRSQADWGVEFSVDNAGAQQFSKAALGKANYPINMFLDRPVDAVLIYENNTFKNFTPADSGERETLLALRATLRADIGNIDVYLYKDSLNSSVLPAQFNISKAIISEKATLELKQELITRGFALHQVKEEAMIPELVRSKTGELNVNRLEAVGLLSAPTLAPELTTGISSYNYVISGSAGLGLDQATRAKISLERIKTIESILKGGALPVQISTGSRTSLPAAFGSEFLKLSLIGIASSLVIISILIGLRYQSIAATMPIVIISLAEFVILLSILGSFTIDLAAMAGIIAAIGVGVDAQIVITDEMVKKEDKEHTLHEKMGLAFGIVKTNVIVAIFSMIPLFFSGLVEVIGFSISTILGALLGYMLTRPSYAALVERTLGATEVAELAKATGHSHSNSIKK